MIETRKSSPVLEERRDLMSNLIRASMEKCVPQEFDFTPRDLLGNISIFLVAGKLCCFCSLGIFLLNYGRGHETTAIMLSSAIALLATHQDEQEELYKHVRSVVPDGRLPVRHGRAVSVTLCSHHPTRPIRTFHSLLGFLRLSTSQCAFSLP